MIIWSGWGILVIFIGLGMSAIMDWVMGSLFGYQARWMSALGYTIGGGIIWFLGNKLNRGQRTFIDKETGKEFNIRPKNSLFFIPFQYWGIIFGGVGIITLLTKG